MKRRREHAAEQAAGLACDGTAETPATTGVAADDLVAVDADDLAAVEQDQGTRQAAEVLERRLGDLELRNELALAGFTGPVWDRFAHELARYGHAVVMAWLWTGEMFAQCKAKYCYPGPSPPSWTHEDRMSLANDTVAQAIINFRKGALIAGKWTVEGGASLKTYFIGTCVYAFPNFYRQWRTDQAKQRQLHQDGLPDDLAGSSTAGDPAELALQALRVWSGFDGIQDIRTKTAVLLQEMGYSYDEIADVLQTTRGAVNEMLRRQRRRGARDAEGGGTDE